jgi:general secretion pathway protein G
MVPFAKRRAFTLVEILIVVVILGILSAIVVPQFSNATDEASSMATLSQLNKIRQALAIYHTRNNAQYPNITAGVGTWGELVSPNYLREPPDNSWVGSGVGEVIVIGNAADVAYQTTYGWIYWPPTGDLWAGSFDINDDPLPKP